MGEKQSVLLITVDCLRSDHIGCYGYERPTTPELDRFVEDDATQFEHSYSNCPGTRWALQSLHMGVYTQQIDGIGIPDCGQSLASYFQEKGYTTGAFAKNGFLTRDYNYNQGFDAFHGVADFTSEEHFLRRAGRRLNRQLENETIRDEILKPLNEALISTQAFFSGQGTDDGYHPSVTDEDVCGIASEWIRNQQAADRPYFAWVHLMDAHTPYARWGHHLEALRGDTEVDHVVNPSNHVEVGEAPPEKVIDAYDAGIRSADEQIGRLLDVIDDTSIVAITGDHGEEFGRYNPFHSASIYSTMTQVPIIVRAPGLPSGSSAEYPVQHLDIAPTLANAVGGDQLSQWVGDPLQETERTPDSPIYFCLDGQHGVRRGKWKLIRHANRDSDELYRIPHAGLETENLADENPEVLMELANRLDEHAEWMGSQKIGIANTKLNDGKEDLSDAVQENLEELGYLDS